MRRREFLLAASGAAGATAAAGGGAAAAQETTETPGGDGGGTETGTARGNESGGEGGGGGGGGGTETVELVDYAFEPGTDDPLYVTPGTEVTFVWVTDTHNIIVDSQPDEAEWAGYETTENSGFEYSHTFETTGDYEYYCGPHENLGMIGTIVVNEEGAPPDEGGGGPSVPDSAKSIGVATSVAMAAVLGLAYTFLKYGGGGREPAE